MRKFSGNEDEQDDKRETLEEKGQHGSVVECYREHALKGLRDVSTRAANVHTPMRRVVASARTRGETIPCVVIFVVLPPCLSPPSLPLGFFFPRARGQEIIFDRAPLPSARPPGRDDDAELRAGATARRAALARQLNFEGPATRGWWPAYPLPRPARRRPTSARSRRTAA